jgi:hypothetical protein
MIFYVLLQYVPGQTEKNDRLLRQGNVWLTENNQ